MIRETLHTLVDQLPEDALTLAARLLKAVREESDPVLRKLRDAPEDDEPLTSEDEAAIDEAWEEYRQGKAVADNEVDWQAMEQ